MNNIIKKCWRDSSSLILLAKQRCGASSRRHNYDILVQTRPARATTFANSLVFPGGVAENADSSPEWVRLIKSFGYSQENFDALHHVGSVVSPIFETDPVQRHISLRITAIRETFEELGILIGSRARTKSLAGAWAEVITDFNVKKWQTKVSKNPEELFNLYNQLGCYPDIWGLHYWSNWLTPASYPKRFDTAFFVAGLREKPIQVEGSSEVVHVEWSTSEVILKRNLSNEILVFPPQVYELSRLAEFKDIDELVKFAAQRSCFGNELLFPVHVEASDGWIQVLPGDHLYPESVDYIDPSVVRSDKTVSELRSAAGPAREPPRLLRVERSSTGAKFVCDHSPPHHVAMHDKLIHFVF